MLLDLLITVVVLILYKRPWSRKSTLSPQKTNTISNELFILAFHKKKTHFNRVSQKASCEQRRRQLIALDFYLLSAANTKNDEASGMGIILLTGDSDCIRRALSIESSSGSNWPSSSSKNGRGPSFRQRVVKRYSPVGRGENEKGAFFGHRFAFLCTRRGRTAMESWLGRGTNVVPAIGTIDRHAINAA